MAIGTYRGLFRRCNGPPKGYKRCYSNARSYQDSLCLPATDFPLRADHTRNRELFGHLCSYEHYKWQSVNRPKDTFVLHDGPPYANGALHIDIIVRHKSMMGHKVSYIPGWDCHGLPIELKALQSIGVDTDVSTSQLRAKCRQFAESAIDQQQQSLMSWYTMADWDGSWRTMDRDFEIRQLEIFRDMVKAGLIHRKYKPVYWSPSSHSALAEAELEYNENHKSKAVWVKFEVETPDMLQSRDPLSLLIWTTTPWTLPANKAVAVSENIEYCIVENELGEKLVVATSLVGELQAVVGPVKVIQDGISGTTLSQCRYRNRLTQESLPVLIGDHVTSESGTGLVHTAPAHGMDDYLLASRHRIEPFCPVDEHGRYTTEALNGQVAGLSVLTDGNWEILRRLNSLGMLVASKNYKHKYPYDWRTKQPIIVRATAQWFADVEGIKEKALSAIQGVSWIPESGKARLSSYISNRSEWCISRQRSWGVPIPALYDRDGNSIMDVRTINHIIENIRQRGIDAWWSESDAESWVHDDYKGQGLVRGVDTMDVWFDSGTSWSVIKARLDERDGLPLSDACLEGSDQHRGWFQSSLLTYVASSSSSRVLAPYKTVLTHGFTLDQKGRKMSKSLGNVVDPNTITAGGEDSTGYGPDVLRLWVASCDFTKDVAVGPDILKNINESLRKIRTTLRFLLSNLHDFDVSQRITDIQKLSLLDRLALSHLGQFRERCISSYEDFEFNRVFHLINNYVTGNLSSFYFDVIKDRLYAEKRFGQSRTAALTVLHQIFETLLPMVAPIMPSLSEEVWYHANFAKSRLPAQDSDCAIFYKGYPMVDSLAVSVTESESTALFEIRNAVNKVLQQARKDGKIRSSLEASIRLNYSAQSKSLLELVQKYRHEWASFFIVSDVQLGGQREETWSYNSVQSIQGFNLEIEARPAKGHKCPRCWQYTSPCSGSLCGRCTDVIVKQQN